jgi:DNA-binding MarR family transcriptional regulator
VNNPTITLEPTHRSPGADEDWTYGVDMVDGMDPKAFIRDEVPPVLPVAHDLRILQSLRRLMRATEIFSRRLVKAHKITGPQLMCLHKLLESDEGLTVSQLSRAIYLSASTVVGILDRLERQDLVTRVRSATDRRKVLINVTETGRNLVLDAPSPLQQALQAGLMTLPESEQCSIADSLGQLVNMLELQDMDAAPMLDTAEDLGAVESGSVEADLDAIKRP